MEKNPTLEHGILQYINDAAYGDMKELITDVGINDDSIPFINFAFQQKVDENLMFESDGQLNYLANAYFTPLDMTDHEEAFVGWNELPGGVPVSNVSWLAPLKPEEFPQSDKLVEIVDQEERYRTGTSPSYQAMI